MSSEVVEILFFFIEHEACVYTAFPSYGGSIIFPFAKNSQARRALPLFQVIPFASSTGSLDLIGVEGKDMEGGLLTLSL